MGCSRRGLETFAFDPSGKSFGAVVIRPRGAVDGERIHSTYSVDVVPASGQTQHGVDYGTFTGSRLEP